MEDSLDLMAPILHVAQWDNQGIVTFTQWGINPIVSQSLKLIKELELNLFKNNIDKALKWLKPELKSLVFSNTK